MATNTHDLPERCGMDIGLALPRNSLVDFRIVFGNPYASVSSDGGSFPTADISAYTSRIRNGLTEAGYYAGSRKGTFSSGCFYAYLREKDEGKEYPRMKVYIHPNEMAGWAPRKDVDTLLRIAGENPCIFDEELVYSQKVYRLEDEAYFRILQSAEARILAWLAAFKRQYPERSKNAPDIFDRIFGVKRLSCRRLFYDDPVARMYISGLMDRV